MEHQPLTEKGVVLMTAQVIGGMLAGGVLRGAWGHDRAVSFVSLDPMIAEAKLTPCARCGSHMGGGNFFDATQITPGQVLLTETMSSLTLL